MVTASKEIYISDFDDDDIIEYLECNGYQVIMQSQVEAEENTNNAIYDLYRDFISGNNFERKLKIFFEDQLDILVK